MNQLKPPLFLAFLVFFVLAPALPVYAQGVPALKAAILQLTPTPEEIVPVETATPGADGAIIHEVRPGQAMWSIAIAYNTTIAEIAGLNNLDPQNPLIYAGQKLVIWPGATATATSATQATPEPSATRTPRPTSTRMATATPRPTRTPLPTFTPTEKPFFPQVKVFQSFDRRTLGIGVIAVCSLGLLWVVVSSLRKR